MREQQSSEVQLERLHIVGLEPDTDLHAKQNSANFIVSAMNVQVNVLSSTVVTGGKLGGLPPEKVGPARQPDMHAALARSVV